MGQIFYAEGVKFPATQVPNADANALDDYEEGTWTAAFVCGDSGTITINPDFNTGSYTKIGRQVTINGYFQVASVSSPLGALTITGLPFVVGAGSEGSHAGALSLICNGLENTAVVMPTANFDAGSTSISIKRYSAGTIFNIVAADIKAGSDFLIGGTYFV